MVIQMSQSQCVQTSQSQCVQTSQSQCVHLYQWPLHPQAQCTPLHPQAQCIPQHAQSHTGQPKHPSIQLAQVQLHFSHPQGSHCRQTQMQLQMQPWMLR